MRNAPDRMSARNCPRCDAPLKGYVDECPSCGMQKPVAMPWHVYAVMAVILAATIWFLLDLESTARAILAAREGFGWK